VADATFDHSTFRLNYVLTVYCALLRLLAANLICVSNFPACGAADATFGH